ncbi:MAG: hypothetical protein LBG15_00185 [Dysgonamonadaceae bacterium]|jgi:hypothetical protein|nr:hypothetical protein [Dysgonamonadaceae bacterium]
MALKFKKIARKALNGDEKGAILREMRQNVSFGYPRFMHERRIDLICIDEERREQEKAAQPVHRILNETALIKKKRRLSE